MKYIVYILAVIFLYSINVGLLPLLTSAGSVPNLLLLLVIVFALDRDSLDFFFLAGLSGLLLDASAGAFFGSYTLGFLLLAYLLNLLVDRLVMFRLNWKSALAILVFGNVFLFLFIWFYNLLVAKLGWQADYISFTAQSRVLLMKFLYNAALFYPIKLFADFLRQLNIKLFAKRGHVQ